MRGKMKMLLISFLLISCSKGVISPDAGIDYEYGNGLSHGMIVLGNRLENPYKTKNITKALESLYPTKAGRVEVETTDLYVRFLPADKSEYQELEDMGLELVDHPLDYDIAVDGDWYHDPEVPEDKVTWQYTVVPVGFDFPEIEYEIIDECHLSSDQTKSDGVDWDAVEREAYIITGNQERLLPDDVITKSSSKVCPSGRITIVDENANGGKPFGVAGVRVSCNSFIRFSHAYTDRDGYYMMPGKFSTKLRYRLVFQNETGFAIGINLILVPASVSTLGKSDPSGVNITITKESDEKLFRRCVVNNAAYDYYARCSENDLDISQPPADMRFWIFADLEASSAVMLHHGAFISNDLITGFLGDYVGLIKFLLPDITIGVAGKDDYRSIYSTVCHELAHASHFTKVELAYWNKYICYILESYVRTGGMTYGDGSSEYAGYCEIGEMWAYFLESRMFKDRYGGSFPTFGTSYWFYPQIFRYLEERGISVSQLFGVLDGDVVDRTSLKLALIEDLPQKKSVIEHVFSRY